MGETRAARIGAFFGGMNDRGNLLIMLGAILFVILGLSLALPIMMELFQPLNIIIRVILIFVIFMTVRGYLGNSVITIIITAVLVYFLVFKWWWIGASTWLFITLLSLGVFSVVVFGMNKIIKV